MRVGKRVDAPRRAAFCRHTPPSPHAAPARVVPLRPGAIGLLSARPYEANQVRQFPRQVAAELRTQLPTQPLHRERPLPEGPHVQRRRAPGAAVAVVHV